MRRIAIGLVAGVLGMFLLAPCVKAQAWQDMQNDREAIETGQEQLRRDRQELRNDLRNGNYSAATHERTEMNRRRANIAERQEDLYDDIAHQNNDNDYHGHGKVHHHWRHHHHHDEEDDE